MAKNKLRNGFQPNNNQQQRQPQAPTAQTNAQVPAATEVATLEDVNNDIEMMSQEDAAGYYSTYEDMENAFNEMVRCNVPTKYISAMMGDVLDLLEVNETEGGLIRTQAQVDEEIAKMEAVATAANEALGMSINLYEDDTEAGKRFRELFQFDEAAPANQSEGGREVLIPKANEEALDLIFQEWTALSLTGYNAVINDKGQTVWAYNDVYENVDAMYSAQN